MENGFTIRWGWLRAMYIYTLVGAGGLGFGLIVFPAATKAMMGFPAEEWASWALRLCPAGGRTDRHPRPSRSLEIRPFAALAARLQAALARRLRYSSLPQRRVPEVCRRHVHRIPHLYHRQPDRHPVRLPVLEETSTLTASLQRAAAHPELDRMTLLREPYPGGAVQEGSLTLQHSKSIYVDLL